MLQMSVPVREKSNAKRNEQTNLITVLCTVHKIHTNLSIISRARPFVRPRVDSQRTRSKSQKHRS